MAKQWVKGGVCELPYEQTQEEACKHCGELASLPDCNVGKQPYMQTKQKTCLHKGQLANIGVKEAGPLLQCLQAS